MTEMILVPPTTFAIPADRWAPFQDGVVSPDACHQTWDQIYNRRGQRPAVGRDEVYTGMELICIAMYLKIPLIECQYMPDFRATEAADRIAEIFKHAKRTTDSTDDEPGSP